MNDFCNYFPKEEFKTDFETSLVESCQSPVENNYLNYSNLEIEFCNGLGLQNRISTFRARNYLNVKFEVGNASKDSKLLIA